jgi:hypothetical protein
MRTECYQLTRKKRKPFLAVPFPGIGVAGVVHGVQNAIVETEIDVRVRAGEERGGGIVCEIPARPASALARMDPPLLAKTDPP